MSSFHENRKHAECCVTCWSAIACYNRRSPIQNNKRLPKQFKCWEQMKSFLEPIALASWCSAIRGAQRRQNFAVLNSQSPFVVTVLSIQGKIFSHFHARCLFAFLMRLWGICPRFSLSLELSSNLSEGAISHSLAQIPSLLQRELVFPLMERTRTEVVVENAFRDNFDSFLAKCIKPNSE